MPTPSNFIQGTQTALSGSSQTTSMAGVTAGDMLGLLISSASTNNRTYTISDDKSNSWQQAVFYNGPTFNQKEGIFFAPNVAAGNTIITVSVDFGLSDTATFIPFSIRNCSLTSPLDQTSQLEESVDSNTHTSSASASVIDTASDVITIVCGSLHAPATLTTPGSGYTQFSYSTSTDTVLWQYMISSAALINEQGAWGNTGTARKGTSVIVSFKADASPSNPYLLVKN